MTQTTRLRGRDARAVYPQAHFRAEDKPRREVHGRRFKSKWGL